MSDEKQPSMQWQSNHTNNDGIKMNESEEIEVNKKVLRWQLESNKNEKNRIEGYILTKGILFIGREPSKNIIKTIFFEPQSKHCYYDSQRLAIDKEFKYFEGYAFDGIAPMEHAWCVANGKVIDVTWEAKDREFEDNRDKTCIYWGVEIPLDLVRKKRYERGGTTESLILEYMRCLSKHQAQGTDGK